MSEALQLRPVESLTDAAAYALLAIEIIASELERDLPRTGLAANDRSNAELRQLDRDMQAEVAPYNMIYFGHTNSYQPHLYNALLAGYNPTERQIQACLDERGQNFIWDEAGQLHYDHDDVYEILQRYGHKYRGQEISDEYPVSMPYVGAYAVPRSELRNILVILYERGQKYRAEGMGFPWWSDYDAEAMK